MKIQKKKKKKNAERELGEKLQRGEEGMYIRRSIVLWNLASSLQRGGEGTYIRRSIVLWNLASSLTKLSSLHTDR